LKTARVIELPCMRIKNNNQSFIKTTRNEKIHLIKYNVFVLK
jgi:hypothetical protein